ncbi:UvrB/UvrC motif-containing protein [Devosia sp. PTR5]|jgi:hypothetical protein|uniref:UvrB/UvrC motif-containing protein n=1 Tax=Devosia oryzisoli TaxID=2774138 RepID=A0A927IS03_9HYPH|nr:UvrB/UvrC motif-containing protein [Devosia oryzisoli]MBD8067260.1 UvrB/UvrC motif-containing protein [Devosia oryzisoli]
MSSRSNHARLVALEKEMEEAAAAFDFERAAALRDEIARWKGETGDGTVILDEDGNPVKVSVGQAPPGQIGLGSNAPVRQPPKGWVKPKKPDFMIKTVKPRGGR